MKKTITALCVAAVASWVMTAGAQTQSTTEQLEKTAKKAMTFTGCVQEGVTPGTYMLTNVTKSGSGMSGTSGSGTSGTGTSGMGESTAPMTFELVPNQGVELKNHVGHQVQITGMLDKDHKKSSSGTSGTGGSTSSSGTSGQSGSTSMSGMEHKLKVQSVKMVSETCTSR